MGIFIIVGIFMVIGWIVQYQLRKRFKKYAKVQLDAGLSGAEVAEKMMHDNGIYDVEITAVDGKLTDHYNPANKTINLSKDVYEGRNVSAAAVAAHETGHAIQHAKAYSFLNVRTALVPVVSASSKIMNFIFIAGLFFSFILHMFPFSMVLLVVVICQALITLFSLVTLPVEFDASKRALVWLENAGITQGKEQKMANDALRWAAGTYLVAALAALTTLFYYLSMFLGADD